MLGLSRIDLPQWLFAQLARDMNGARTSGPVTSPERQYNRLFCTRSTRYPCFLPHFYRIFSKLETSVVRTWRTEFDGVISS